MKTSIWQRKWSACVSVCLSVCGSHNSSSWNTGSSLGQLWYMPHQIKSKQVYGKWDGPWRADTLIWNQDNFSDSVYTTFVYWYKNSFCLQINAIHFSFCTRTKRKPSYHINAFPIWKWDLMHYNSLFKTLLFLFQHCSYIGAFITLNYTVAKSCKLHKILQIFFL